MGQMKLNKDLQELLDLKNKLVRASNDENYRKKLTEK